MKSKHISLHSLHNPAGGDSEKLLNSKNLSQPLDIAIFIAYVSRDYDEHLFSFENPKTFFLEE
jgi:hypothetical protein